MRSARRLNSPAVWGLGCALALLVATESRADILIHHYDLTTSLNDTMGGPSLVADGGTLVAGTGYQFSGGAGQGGLTLSGGFGPGGSFAGNYRIEIKFHFNGFSNNGYQKIIDPKDQGIDQGLYAHRDSGTTMQLDYYTRPGTPANDHQGPPEISLGAPDIDVQLKRDGATGMVTGSVNGTPVFSYDDSVIMNAVFNGPNNIVHFFEDDHQTDGGNEQGPGVATEINIFGPGISVVPEPGSLALALLGGLSLAGYGRRRFLSRAG
jgi:hypothetical protein